MKKILGLIALLLVSSASAEIALYCQEIASGGVVKDSGQWRAGKFKLYRHTFLVSDDHETLKTKYEDWSCEAKSAPGRDFLICLSLDPLPTIPSRLILNLPDLSRFQLINGSAAAYVGGEHGNARIAIGDCERF